MSRRSIFPRKRLPNNTDGAQTIENQTILVGGVYHQRYAAARHYHHQLTSKGVGYRSLVGFYATGRQMEAYDGR